MASSPVDPFGYLFLHTPSGQTPDLPAAIYDEQIGISFTIGPEGVRVPLVELRPPQSTSTATSVERETQDADEPLPYPVLATQTVTEAGGEEGDPDEQHARYSIAPTLGTETVTRADGEVQDADAHTYPYGSDMPIIVCSTGTATKADGEQGDPD